MRKKMLAFVMILAGMTIVFLALVGLVKTQHVQAQQSTTVNNSTKQKWEYCAIVDSYGMNDQNDKPAVGYAWVVYFDASGYREERIKVQGDTVGIQATEVYEKARQKALSLAIAQLGGQGWEMVGELPFTKRFHSDEKDRTALYFKRSIL